MVYETEEGSKSYVERSSLGIFRAIQIHVGDNPGPIDPLEHEKGTRGRL